MVNLKNLAKFSIDVKMSHSSRKVYYFQHPKLEDAKKCLDRICCVCFYRKNLLELKSYMWNDATLLEIIKYCLPFQEFSKKWSPTKICTVCVGNLLHTYVFLSKASSAQIILRNKIVGDCKEDNRISKEFPALEHENKNDPPEFVPTKTEDKSKLSHNEPTTIRCGVCHTNFDNYNKYKRHKKQQHKKDVKSMCDECGIFFTSREGLARHKTRHKTRDSFVCEKCGKCLKTATGLRVHIKEVHLGMLRPKNFTCSMCGKTFRKKITLNCHMLTHTKEKPHSCETCGKKFSRKENLNRHTMLHKGIKPFSCVVCKKGFIQKNCLKLHERNWHGIVKTMKCIQCEDQFDNPREFTAHLAEKHNVKDYSLKGLREESSKCQTCGKIFRSKLRMMEHLTEHTGVKNLECNVCKKRFRWGQLLKLHMLIHTNEKPHECNECGMRFRQKSHLMYHTASHLGEKNFVCQYCNKAFTLKGNLTVHLRIHTGETPHICKICDKKYNDTSGLKRHMRSQHPAEERALAKKTVKSNT